ncbi:FeS cluster assembly scaffold IscU [Pisolithus microcarpus]|nr:FeS cluster assembly scaffold IscU [Pisolithus microcarpus]
MFRSALSKTIFNTTAAARPPTVGIVSVLSRGYHEKVISHYENPRNVGSLPKGDLDVGTGLVGAPACGDVMKLQIRVDENGVISDVKFKTFGCGSAIASSSYLTERVKGLSLDDAGKIKNTEIAKNCAYHLSNSTARCWRRMLFRSAIRDYRSKRTKTSDSQQASYIDVTQNSTAGQTPLAQA